MPKPRLLFAITKTLRSQLFSAESEERLAALFETAGAESDERIDSATLAQHIPGVTALITGWGTPPVTPAVLAAATDLRIIAHTAGSIRAIIPLAALEKGIVVTHAAPIIAEAVAEFTVLMMLTCLRWPHPQNAWLHEGKPWQEVRATNGWLLQGKKVGLIGCGYVGKRVIRLLSGFHVEVLVYDPYLSAEQAKALGVRKVSLEELFRSCFIISNHAPTTPETDRMVGAEHFKSMQDGAIFINTARARAVDQEAMLAELATRRIRAALDVFDPEPLPTDSPLRKLENVYLTPHMAGLTIDTRLRQGAAMVDELERFLHGQPLQWQISMEAYPRMA